MNSPDPRLARSARPLLGLALVAGLAACDSSGRRGVEVTATSIYPAPGSQDVSRRVEMRVVFDREIDATSIDASTCRITQIGPLAATGALAAGGPALTLTTRYDASARLLTLQPVQPLARGGIYRIELTTGLRVLTGEAFARPITWELSASSERVFGSAFDIDAGTLLACETSRRGGALAVMAFPDLSLHYRHYDGVEWSPARPVGIQDVFAADVADDETGRVVVAAITRAGRLLVAQATTGAFLPVEDVAAADSLHLDVDVAASGHVLLATFDGLLSGQLRSRVPGLGWTAPFAVHGGLPHVRVQPAGDGLAVAAIHDLTAGSPATTACWRFGVDATGNWSRIDPAPLPFAVAAPFLSRAVFRGDRVLLAAAPVLPSLGATAFELRDGVWLDLGLLLGNDPAAISLAQGPGELLAAATTIAPGLRPVLRNRMESGFAGTLLGRGDQPAPHNPTTGVAITDDFATHVFWTAKVNAAEGAPVRLMATSWPALGPLGEEVVVDGPFAPEEVPVRALRVVAFGQGDVVAVWSRNDVVRYTILR